MELDLLTDPDFYVAMLAVKLKFGDRHLFIFTVYLPHWAKCEGRSRALCDTLTVIFRTINADDFFICIGDFNMTHVNWVEDESDRFS